IKASDNAGQAKKETEPDKDYILLPLWTADLLYFQDPKSSHDNVSKPSSDDGKKVDENPRKDSECKDQEKEDNVNSTNNVNTVNYYSIFDFPRDNEDDGAVADMNNLDTTIQVCPNPTTRIHKDHPIDQVIGDLQSSTQTRRIAFKRVNTFEDFRIELVEGKEKRAGTELIQEITKKQKVEDNKEQ
ncbi:hypothetical protein Tco_0106837, partial [Tanacetum coccineum]